ncbi:MAG: hypothetical protein JXJ22_11130 [Bacteroidales bacterium]|nr:hypothetical protein [Bacteroidales bacterium]
MKKILLLIVSVVFTGTLMAGNADLFSYDKAKVTDELASLQMLEDFVIANPTITLTDLQNQENTLVNEMNLIPTGFYNSMMGEPPLGISSFIWGCVFGIAGVAIVYFVADDKEETTKAFKGCVVGTLAYTAVYVVLYFVAWNSVAWY